MARSSPYTAGLRQAQITGAAVGREVDAPAHMEDLADLNGRLQEVRSLLCAYSRGHSITKKLLCDGSGHCLEESMYPDIES
jgi:hypothetical protein